MKKTNRRNFIQIMVLTLVLMILPVHVMAEEDTSVNPDENQNEITETNVEEPTQEVFEDPTPVIVDIPQEGGDDTYIPQNNNDDNQYQVEEEKKIEEEKKEEVKKEEEKKEEIVKPEESPEPIVPNEGDPQEPEEEMIEETPEELNLEPSMKKLSLMKGMGEEQEEQTRSEKNEEEIYYSISAPLVAHGQFNIANLQEKKIDKQKAGEYVLIKGLPNDGYVLGSVIYTYGYTTEFAKRPDGYDDSFRIFKMPDADVTITVTFTKEIDNSKYRIMPQGPSKVIVTADKRSASEGETVTLTVYENPAYYLYRLYYCYEPDMSKVAYEFNVQPGKTTYTFEMPAHDIYIYRDIGKNGHDINCYGDTWGHLSSNISYAMPGDTITVFAHPKYNGYELVYLSYTYNEGGKSVTKSIDINGTLSFVMPDSGVTVNGAFRKKEDTYSFSAGIRYDHCKIHTDKRENIAEGEEVTLWVYMDPYYELTRLYLWDYNAERFIKDIDISSVDGTYYFKMPAVRLVTLGVETKKVDTAHYIYFNETEDGSLSDTMIANEGETVTIPVTPNEGYLLDTLTWSYVDDRGKTITNTITKEPYTFTMPDRDVTVNATFARDTTVKLSTKVVVKNSKGREDYRTEFYQTESYWIMFAVESSDNKHVLKPEDIYVKFKDSGNAIPGASITVENNIARIEFPLENFKFGYTQWAYGWKGDQLYEPCGQIGRTRVIKDGTPPEISVSDFSPLAVKPGSKYMVKARMWADGEPYSNEEIYVSVMNVDNPNNQIGEKIITDKDGYFEWVSPLTAPMNPETLIRVDIVVDMYYTYNIDGFEKTFFFKGLEEGQNSVTLSSSPTEGGRAQLNKTIAEEGEMITVTPTVYDGYRLVSMTYQTETGDPIEMDLDVDVETGKVNYGYFEMLDEDVNVTVTFEEIPLPEKYNIYVNQKGSNNPVVYPSTAEEGQSVTIELNPLDIEKGYAIQTATVIGEDLTEIPVIISEDKYSVSFNMPSQEVYANVVLNLPTAYLESIDLSDNAEDLIMTPSFDPEVTNYKIYVPEAFESINLKIRSKMNLEIDEKEWAYYSYASRSGQQGHCAVDGVISLVNKDTTIHVSAIPEEGKENPSTSYTFTIIKESLYRIEVVNGAALMENNDIVQYAPAGASIIIEADEEGDNRVFTGWLVVKGSVSLQNRNDMITSFLLPAEDVVIVASYRDLEVYTVIWLNGDGKELKRSSYYENQEEPTIDLIPKKKEDNQYTYEFDKWDEGTVNGTTKTYKPLFKSIKKTSTNNNTTTNSNTNRPVVVSGNVNNDVPYVPTYYQNPIRPIYTNNQINTQTKEEVQPQEETKQEETSVKEETQKKEEPLQTLEPVQTIEENEPMDWLKWIWASIGAVLLFLFFILFKRRKEEKEEQV